MVTRIPGYSLRERNTFGMDVSCALWVEYDSPKDLADIDFGALPQPVRHIGGGSNLLFTGDFPGTLMHSAINYIKYFDVGSDRVPVAVGAGVLWDDFVAKACADGLWGAENLSGIPGEVGAAAVQNIGAYGVEAGDIIAGVTCWDTVNKEKVAFKTPDLAYGYRDSFFKQPEVKGRYIVTGVLLTLSRVPSPKLGYKGLSEMFPDGTADNPQAVREAILQIRASKLPAVSELGSAGSFFKNPVVTAEHFARIANGFESVPHYELSGGLVKVPAAWMIEQCGFKGAKVGGAEVYRNQPLLIVNTGGAQPEDILALKDKVIAGVRERFGVELEMEVETV